MARKKANKELTIKEQLQQERENGINFIKDEVQHLNEPTYKFKIGDKVKYGALKDCTVKEVLYDGKVYGLHCISTEKNYENPYDREVYRVARWTSVRPLTNGDSKFSKNQNVKINFNNSMIKSLIHKYYAFGVDMNPEYQRGYVWELEDKQLLIDSIFNNIDIGKFAFIYLDDKKWAETGNGYEILDGKQRLSTIIEFYENRFPYNGVYYNDLSAKDKNVFLNHHIVQGEVREADRKAVLKYFLMLNRTGKSMDKSQLDKIEKMLEE